MRVAIGAMKHESNTFTSRTTGIEAFDPVAGEELFDDEAWMETSATAGFLDVVGESVDLVPTHFGRSLPSGVVEADAYEQLSSGIVDRVDAAEDLDAVYLDLHGSMFAEEEPDPEGALLASVRRSVGPDTPVVVSLDMHATVTERMVDAADGFTAYRTAPHTDVVETGARAAELLRTIVREDRSTEVERVRLPMLLAGEQSETDAQPMRDLIGKLEAADRQDGVLGTSYLLGFPWADNPHGGVFALAVTDEAGPASAMDVSESLAAAFWERRREFDFTTEARSFAEAVDRAVDSDASPTVIADSGDNPTAGATEDLTYVVRELLHRDISDALVAVIADEDARRRCAEAGTETEVSLEVGRITPDDDEPLRVEARVEALEATRGLEAAIIAIDGLTVILTSERTSVTDPDFLREVGLDPAEFGLLVVKSGYLSPAYQSLAADQVLALTPGDTNEVLSELPYRETPRPIYPLDSQTEWTPQDDAR